MNQIKQGGKLILYSVAGIIFSYVYFTLNWRSEFFVNLGAILALGYLMIWFVFGFTLRSGIKDGLTVGTIGASPGIVLAVLSLLLLPASRDGDSLWLMVPWFYPFLGAANYVHNGGLLSNFFPHLSVILVIVTTGIGSAAGEYFKKLREPPDLC